MMLRRIGLGHYETRDGRYSVVREPIDGDWRIFDNLYDSLDDLCHPLPWQGVTRFHRLWTVKFVLDQMQERGCY